MSAPESDPFRLKLDIRLIVVLFIAFRLIVLLVDQPRVLHLPDGSPLAEGVMAYGDFAYHFGVAEEAAKGVLPYRDYWFEYPPLIPLLSGSIYFFSRSDFSLFADMLAILLLLVDVGNLLLIARIGSRLHGPDTGRLLALVYALLAAPLVLNFWNFEGLVIFAILLALALLIERRDWLSGGVIALGALVKLVPLTLLIALWRVRSRPQALRITLLSTGIVVVGFAALLIFAPKYGWPSLMAQFSKPSAQTVWALLDQNFRTGAFVADRFDPAAIATSGHPAVIPFWLRTLVFGALGLFAFATTRRKDDAGLVMFTTLVVVLLFLWSANWSTQWQIVLIPLILLTLADFQAVMLCVALEIVCFIEYPFIFMRGVGPDGVLGAPYVPLFALVVIARTMLIAIIGLLAYLNLRRNESHAASKIA